MNSNRIDNNDGNRQSKTTKPAGKYDLVVTLIITIMLVGYLLNITQTGNQPQKIPYSEFIAQVENNLVQQVEIRGQKVFVRITGDSENYDYETTIPTFTDGRFLDTLKANDVEITIESSDRPLWLTLALSLAPWLLLFALFAYSGRIMRSRMSGGAGMFGFTKSRARRFDSQDSGPGYENVAGLESAKQELQEIIDYLKTPDKFRALGAKMPRGILMMGPPGTGKTLLARATAAEAGVPFYSISGSEFIEMYVGVGASRVRDMFQQAREEAPALIFIDEIDSVGRVRGTGLGGGNDEREQTLNQVLAEMDGFRPDEAVVVLAATNRPDVLDPALLRPGRFDRKIVLELPQKKARKDILLVHTRKTPLSGDVDLDEIAALTVGFSGADIENLVNEAALHAARLDQQQLTMVDFQYARDRIVMGAERKDLINPKERERIASHEAGHALAAFYAEHSDPLQRVSIIPHGRALGMTEQLPGEDRHNVVEDYLYDRLDILLGGRCAEKLLLGNTSSGAADDLQQATQLARHMVMNWGMSQSLGPVGYRSGETHPFLGMELSEPKEFSDATARLIDEEIKRLLTEAENRVFNLLEDRRTELELIRQALLEHESLDQAQIRQILAPGNTSSSVLDIRDHLND